MDTFLVILGVVIVALLGFIVVRLLGNQQAAEPVDDSINQALQRDKAVLEERLRQAQEDASRHENALEAERDRANHLNAEVASKGAQLVALQDRLDQQKTELEALQQQFKTEFENIAGKILKQNTAEFSVQHQKSLDQILSPFKDKIERFEKQVTHAYESELKERVSLKKEVEMLHTLNQRISEEATNLTRALKGDNKMQGNWGEIVLERVLEESGLSKGQEYVTQFSTQNEEGRGIKPDVVVKLPEGKHLIIDSKVSLVDYEAWITAESDEDKALFLKKHVASVRNHVRELGDKAYQSARDLHAPDFVLLFIPIESSFSLAIQSDSSLYQYALDKKIVIVSPTTLLATLRTVTTIWRQEKQTRNVLEIAEQAGRMYDKFVLFIDDMTKLGRNLGTAQVAYEGAMNKLSSGKGNLVGQTEKLRKLGAKATKRLPKNLLEDSATLASVETDDEISLLNDSDEESSMENTLFEGGNEATGS